MDTLTTLLSSRVKAETFRLLFAPGAGELHVREIARRAGLNDATVRQELRRLTGLGLVVRRQDGNRTCYRADTAHPLYSEIRSLVSKTSGLVAVLREALRAAPVRVAFVFGSLADGTEKPDSDVDLMILGDLTLRQVAKLLSGVGERLTREINPHVLTPEEFLDRKRHRDPFLESVLRKPKTFLIGNADELGGMGRERVAPSP